MSHLSTLIQRVGRSIRVNKELDEDAQLVHLLPRIFNLAEYLTYDNDYTVDEKKRAVMILDLFNMPCKIDESKTDFYDLMAMVSGKPREIFSRVCIECGRKLSNPGSMKRGMGPVCHTRRQDTTKMTFPGKGELLESLDEVHANASKIFEGT